MYVVPCKPYENTFMRLISKTQRILAIKYTVYQLKKCNYTTLLYYAVFYAIATAKERGTYIMMHEGCRNISTVNNESSDAQTRERGGYALLWRALVCYAEYVSCWL